MALIAVIPAHRVIGAGISGLTAGKMLNDYGVPLHQLRDLRPHRRQLGVRQPQRAQQRLPVAAHRHLQAPAVLQGLPDARATIPSSRTTPRSRPTSTPTPTPSGCWSTSSSATASCTPGADGGGWEIDDQAGATRQFDLLVVGNGHHWDPRLPDFPGSSPASPSTPTTTSTRRPARPHRQADPGGRSRQQRRGHRGRAVVEVAAEQGDPVDPVERLDRAEIPCGTAGGQVLPHHARTCRCRWQRKVAQMFASSLTGSDPTLYGLPPPNHKFFEAHPTQSVELPLRLGSGDVTPKPNVARLDGDTVHFEDGTSRRVRRDRLRDGLQHHVPVLRPRLHQRAGQPHPALQADVQAGHRRSGVHRFRPGDSDAVPVRGVPGPAVGGVRGGPLRAAVGRRDGAGDRRRPAAARRPLHRPAAAHPAGRLLLSTSTTCAPGRSRPAPTEQAARRRPVGGRRDEVPNRPPAAADAATTAATPCSTSLDQHLRESSSRRRSTSPTSRDAAGRDPLGVLLLLREQGRRGRCADGARCTTRPSSSTSCSPGRPAHRRTAFEHRCSTACSTRWERHRHLFRAMLEARGHQLGGAGVLGRRPGCRSSTSWPR